MNLSLVAIKQHMMQVKTTTLANLCNLFQADAEVMRCMLHHWVQKGKIRPCLKTPACGSKCFKCPASVTESYEWVN